MESFGNEISHKKKYEIDLNVLNFLKATSSKIILNK